MTMMEDTPTDALLDGRYRLIERVGAGGSAEVHRAEDVVLGRIVAVKLLRGEHESALGPARARRETALLASLNHPSIVTLYDAQLEHGRPQYLVMEYVEGQTLAGALGRGALQPAHVAILAHDLAEALHALHARGVVHRDVKPSNVLLGRSTRRGEPWAAKLADFGIAQVLDDPRMTTPGMVVGTAAYMAPEQVRDGEVGPASDVYSLGLVLLEALTGAPAFPRTGGLEAALARLSGPPAIPQELGSGWSLLLTRMTRSDPAERPTAREVASTASGLGGRATAGTEPAGEDDATTSTAATAILTADGTAEGTAPGATKVLPGYGIRTDPPASRRRHVALIAFIATAALAAVALLGVWVGASTAPDPGRIAGVSFVKPPPEPAVDAPSDEAPADGPGNGGEKGKKGDDEDGPGGSGKKDDD